MRKQKNRNIAISDPNKALAIHVLRKAQQDILGRENEHKRTAWEWLLHPRWKAAREWWMDAAGVSYASFLKSVGLTPEKARDPETLDRLMGRYRDKRFRM